METAPKLNWFARQTPTSKAFIIGGTILAIGTIIYLVTRSKEDTTSKKNDNKDDESNYDESEEVSSDSVSTGSVKTETTKVPDTTLPNGGVDCSDIKTNYDRDFDYVKCKGVWYTKAKANPVTLALKETYKDWTSLELNRVASERLNRRYPN